MKRLLTFKIKYVEFKITKTMIKIMLKNVRVGF